MQNVVLRSAYMLGFLVFAAANVRTAFGENPVSEMKNEQDAIIAKWDDLRKKMLKSVKPDPLLDSIATHDMKIRKIFLCFAR